MTTSYPRLIQRDHRCTRSCRPAVPLSVDGMRCADLDTATPPAIAPASIAASPAAAVGRPLSSDGGRRED